MNKRILFYSSVRDKELFKIQRFYAIDIMLLEKLGYKVDVTNCISDFLGYKKYDIAFIYFYRYGFFAALLARFMGKKVYFTGGIDNLEKTLVSKYEYYLQRLFFKLCYMISNQCIIVSETDLNHVKSLYSRKGLNKLILSSHTIEIHDFLIEDINLKDKIFLSIAWMGSKDNVIRKGVDVSIRLFNFLIQQKEYNDYRFFIVGKCGEGSDYLRGICKTLGIEHKVIFTGEIAEEKKIELLKRSRYYFQLSIYEGFGIAALEALAAKNIVIHSGNGGLASTIKNYGIKVDLSESMESSFSKIYQNMLDFNTRIFKDLDAYLIMNYSNEKRERDLKNILLK